MESVMLAVKFILFYGLEAIVLALVGVVLLAGAYQFLKDQARIVLKGPFPDAKTIAPKHFGDKIS
jgi:hypothetical protein